MMELNKVYKFTYHYNCCCHIVIKEKIHVNIKTNNKICVTLYDLVSQQKFCEMSSDCYCCSLQDISGHTTHLFIKLLHKSSGTSGNMFAQQSFSSSNSHGTM